MSQPDWKYVTNLGDASPIEHGGKFLWVDAAGVYKPEVAILEPPRYEMDLDDPKARWTEHRFIVENCTFTNGILSDNQFHPNHPAWFAAPYNASRPQDGPGGIIQLASFIEAEPDELVQQFIHPDVRVRASAWIIVGDYHGLANLDNYPNTFTRDEIEARYHEELMIERTRRRAIHNKTFMKVWAHHPRGGKVEGYASDLYQGLNSVVERKIAPSVDDAACFRGVSVPDEQVNVEPQQ